MRPGCACIAGGARLDSDPPPIQSGCACRSDSGLAHLECLVEKALSQQAHRGGKVWWECQTCGQDFTGAMRTGLGEAWWSRVRGEAEESAERLAATHHLADCRLHDGEYADAERMSREVLSVRRRVLGEEHPDTLRSAGNLATTLAHQAKFCEAEEVLQATLEAYRRMLGHAHPDTLETAQSLENVRSCMHAEQPTRTVPKAVVRRTERAATPALSPTALAEADRRARAAEAELLAMLDLEEPEAGVASGSAKGKAKAKGRASKAKGVEGK